MTEEIMNSDGSRNWEANILLDNVKRLEQENKELKEQNRYYKTELKLSCNELDKSNNWQIAERREKNKYRSALEEIRKMVTSPYPGEPRDVLNIINEVLNA